MFKGDGLASVAVDAYALSSDVDLLAALRDGDADAYTELWRRHIDVALRVARRYSPEHAEDLASESFLAVYNQVVVVGKGPTENFRAYLFATMRNAAMRLNKEDHLVDTDPELDSVDFNDALSTIEDRAEASDVLAAFQALPDRWQRVLWLTEVEDAKRPRVAADLGIKPNAVSALYRRAREGLRLQWLTQQVPTELDADSGHIAVELPKLVVSGKIDRPGQHISHHLEHCPQCRATSHELVSMHERMNRKTLGVAGFAALAVVLPAATQGTFAAVGVGAAAAILLVGGATIATTLGLLGPLGTTGSSDASEPTGVVSTDTSGGHATSSRSDAQTTATQDSEDDGEGISEVSDSADSPQTGRGNVDPSLSVVSFGSGPIDLDGYIEPDRPRPADPGSVPVPADTPSETFGPGIVAQPAPSGYLAPVLAGTTSPDATVVVEYVRATGATTFSAQTPQYTVPVAEDGTWSFDFRSLISSQTGTYEYRVWAYTDDTTSAVETGQFTLATPVISGFEDLEPFEEVPIAEASTSGIVFQATGPAGGTICLTSVWAGQSATIQLDDSGVAVRRLQMHAGGAYFFAFQACEGDYRGPTTEIHVDVNDPDMPDYGPWGPDPSMTSFEISEL